MAKKHLPAFTDAHDRLKHLIDEAMFYLTEEDILSIQPRADGAPCPPDEAARSIERLLYTPDVTDHPFSPNRLDALALERPDISLLRVLSNPEYFPFACYHLFSMDGVDPLRVAPFQTVTLLELWWRQFPMLIFSRGGSKSSLLALFILLKLTFCPGSQVAVVAKSLRQSMVIWEYCQRIWSNSPVFRDLVGKGHGSYDNGPRRGGNDRCEFRVGDSVALFLPLGPTGETIRGIRAQTVICDEFASVTEEVYSVVVQGFGAVSANPVAKAAEYNRELLLRRLNLWTPELDALGAAGRRGNQSVLSGTASYKFNHFFKYWQNYHDIVATRGDPDRVREVLGGPPPDSFDWRDYSVIRLPWDRIPRRFMDEKTIERARQMSSLAAYQSEYLTIFVTDSDGFYRRSLIERATIGGQTEEPVPPPEFPSCGVVEFGPAMQGREGCKYAYGVDPAFNRDNFAVVVTEVWPDHRRVVFCWTTNKSDHRKKRKSGKIPMDFYAYAVRKLRDMFRRFPPTEVVIDEGSGGAGNALFEAFSEPAKLEEGERPVYPIPDKENPRDTDWMAGDHFLRPVNFGKQQWLKDANWAMRKDLEDRVLLFPRVDEIGFALAHEQDVAAGRVGADGDALEDAFESVLHEIEELKDEMCTIVHTQTSNNTERWDVPEAKVPGQRKGPLKKDRYSALLMANWGARLVNSAPASLPAPVALGGRAGALRLTGEPTGVLYVCSGRMAAKLGGGVGGFAARPPGGGPRRGSGG